MLNFHNWENARNILVAERGYKKLNYRQKIGKKTTHRVYRRDILSINLCQRMNITDDPSEAFPKEATVQPRILAEVKSAKIHSLPMTIENKQSCHRPMLKETGLIDANMYEHKLNENVLCRCWK